MSSYVEKYKIVYDGHDGRSYTEYLYCKYENVWNSQKVELKLSNNGK